ncbi:MAG: glycosyltransferase [Erysipelotrichaceae bacterium]|nr:glycosyltransferase [Erysipelotrichaceae bacterium]
MKQPLVSIIVPVYNCEPYLRRCLDSLLKQDYANFEVLCIDDGSKDNSAQIIKEYPFKYFYQENAGQAAARNRGIELANGEWICFVDGDDAVNEKYLSSLVAGIKEDVGMVVCRINRINEDGKYNVDVMKKYGVITANEALCTINIGPTNKLIKKEIIGKCRFIEGKLRFEDILFTPELLVNAKKINVIEDVLYDYYVRENSTMRRFDKTLDDIFTVLDKLLSKDFYKEYKEEIDYIVFKNGLFGHFSRIVYFDRNTFKKELKKASDYIKKNVPDYWNNKYIRNDKQAYFFVGTRLFKINMLGILALPLKLMEKRVNR